MIKKSDPPPGFPIDEVVIKLKRHYHSGALEFDKEMGVYIGPGEVDLRGIGSGVMSIGKDEVILKVREPRVPNANAYVVLLKKKWIGGWSFKSQIMQIEGGRGEKSNQQ